MRYAGIIAENRARADSIKARVWDESLGEARKSYAADLAEDRRRNPGLTAREYMGQYKEYGINDGTIRQYARQIYGKKIAETDHRKYANAARSATQRLELLNRGQLALFK